MVLGKVKSLAINFDCLSATSIPVYSSGDTVSGRVSLEVSGEIKLKSLKIHARGYAKVRWTESRNAGSNTAYTQNYTEEVEYFNCKDVLLGHERGKLFTYSLTTRRRFPRQRYICTVLVYPFLICDLVEFTISKGKGRLVTLLGCLGGRCCLWGFLIICMFT